MLISQDTKGTHTVSVLDSQVISRDNVNNGALDY